MDKSEKLIKRLEKMRARYEEERERVKAYEQIVRIYSVYIALLLRALGATGKKPFVLLHADVKKGMSELETRAIPTNEGFKMYAEKIGKNEEKS